MSRNGMPRFSASGMSPSSGMTPSRGSPAVSMASSMVVCRALSIFFCTRFTTRCTCPAGKRRSSITVRWASRSAAGSVVVTTTTLSATAVASWKPCPSPAGASIRQ